jgi:hypothetical protein
MAISTLKLVGELLEGKTGEKIEVDREVLSHLINDSYNEYEQLVNELKQLKDVKNPSININVKNASIDDPQEFVRKLMKNLEKFNI